MIKKILISLTIVTGIFVFVANHELSNTSGGEPPPIAQGLPKNVGQARQVFADRISARFPPGTRKDELIQTLREQNFTIVDLEKKAVFVRSNIVCRDEWNIRWQESGEFIAKATGDYRAICS